MQQSHDYIHILVITDNDGHMCGVFAYSSLAMARRHQILARGINGQIATLYERQAVYNGESLGPSSLQHLTASRAQQVSYWVL
jgi:hypothetical protein